MKITIPEKFMGVPVEGAMERVLRDESREEESGEKTRGFVVSSNDYWEIPGVECRNGIYSVRLLKTLLDNGNAKTQDEWIEYSKQAKQKGDFYTGSMSLQYAMFKALSSRNAPESLEAREFIKEQMRNNFLMTTTRLKYNPSKKDEVVHDYNMNGQFVILMELVAPDRFIGKDDSKVLEALLSDGDFESVNRTFNFINGTNAYIWRLNSKPKQIAEAVARFGTLSDEVLLYCSGDPANRYSSLGVFGVAQDKESLARQGRRK